MPLIAMNDYMDGIENLKVSNSGIPGAYPLGLNGLGDAGADWENMISADGSLASSPEGKAIQAALNSGDMKSAASLIAQYKINGPAQAPTYSAPSTSSGYTYSNYKEGAGSPVYSVAPKYTITPSTVQAASGKWGASPAATFNFSKGSSAPTGSLQSNVDTFVNAFKQIFETAAPAFKGRGKGAKTVIQRDPDYTTYAVIVGAVIVASVLAIAVGKSGRRKE